MKKGREGKGPDAKTEYYQESAKILQRPVIIRDRGDDRARLAA
jgi:hypothetical protein